MTALSKRQVEFGSYFIAAGYPAVSAAAICGNATQENQCLPTTAGPKDHGSDGVLQWRLRRLANLQGLANWDTLKTQAEFTILELQAGLGTKFFDVDYRALEADLRAGTKSLATLVANFVDAYERPSMDGRALDARIKYANDSLAAIIAAQPGPVITVGRESMPTLDPMLVSVIEALLSGLVKAILQQVAAPTARTTSTVGPTVDPSALAKLVATELSTLIPTGVKQ